MKLIGVVEGSEKVNISDLDLLRNAGGALRCVAQTEEFILTGDFYPTKGGGLGTEVIGFEGTFVDAEDNSKKAARLMYDPSVSTQWLLYLSN